MADWLGEDHVAFGTDMNGLIGPGDHQLRRPAPRGRHWERRGMAERRIRKLAIENYARVLRQAMASR